MTADRKPGVQGVLTARMANAGLLEIIPFSFSTTGLPRFSCRPAPVTKDHTVPAESGTIALFNDCSVIPYCRPTGMAWIVKDLNRLLVGAGNSVFPGY